MKKLIIAVLAALSFFNANAFTSGIQDVQPKGGFNLGLQFGLPPANGDDGWGDKNEASMPMVSIDGNWTVASGLFNAGKFGRNGAIDLGFYYGICHYDKKYNTVNNTLQNCLLFRSAFHFEFLPKMDVYGGVFMGTNFWSPTDNDAKWSTKTKFCGGPFIGCKYYLTQHFGFKAEFGDDLNDGNYPNAAFGFAFKF